MKQATIRQSFTLTGKGLHTGVVINATLRPAETDSGIRFARTDMPDSPAYQALADYVGATSRGTVLERGSWKVSTIEHLMAALYAFGITNCLIELDGPEVPILDGSSRIWLDELKKQGKREQDKDADVLVITEPISFDNGNGSTMLIEPSVTFSVIVNVDYHSPVLGQQTALLPSIEDFDTQMASARTFCFLREVLPLLELGFIRGGDLNNALVIYDKRIWQWGMNRMARKLGQQPVNAKHLGYLSPLIYPNEPARHKLLDLIGDMALMGKRLQAKITATRPGHGFNTQCCKNLRRIYNL